MRWWSASATAILGDDGRPDRRRIAAVVFGDPTALQWLEALLHPLVSREYLEWREQLARLDDPPAVCVTEVPLLYEVGAEERFDRVIVITAPRQLREQRRRVPRDSRDDRLLARLREDRAGGLPLRQHGHVRGSRPVGDGVMEELTRREDRAAPDPPQCGLDAIVGRRGARGCARGRRARGVAVGARLARSAPLPAALRGDRHGARAQLRPRPGAARGRDLHREPVSRRRPLVRGRRRPDAAPPRDRSGDRVAHRRRPFRGQRPARPRDQRPLRLVVPARAHAEVRQHPHGARRVPRRSGQRRPLARAGCGDPVPGDARIR